MQRIAGEYQGIEYVAQFSAGQDNTIWTAVFRRPGEQALGNGTISSQRYELPSVEDKVHRTMELYIELLMLRGDNAWRHVTDASLTTAHDGR